MSTRHIRWLLAELPELVAGGALSLDAAARLEAHFASRSVPRRRWLALGLGVLGAALIGAGLAMVLAHNWEQLTRPARLAVALALLAGAQGLSGFSLLRRAGSAPWAEATATGLVFAIGGSLGLITQTYHVGLDLGEFVGVWTLLALPVVYIQDSRVAAALAWAGVLWTALAGDWPADEALVFWGLALLLLPFMLRAQRDARAAALPALPLWVAAVAVAIAGLAFPPFRHAGLWIPHLTCLYAGMFALGSLERPAPAPAWRRPFWLVGAGCASTAAVVLSYSGPWPASVEPSADPLRLGVVIAVTLLCLAASALAGVRAARDGRWVTLLFCSLPAFAAAGLAALAVDLDPLVPALLMNAWLLATGLTGLVTGSRRGEIGTANAGLALLTALAVARFFDFDISLVGRGVAFVAVGAAFLLLNVVLQRARAGRIS
jgi:uncharacterized membrane protein